MFQTNFNYILYIYNYIYKAFLFIVNTNENTSDV